MAPGQVVAVGLAGLHLRRQAPQPSVSGAARAPLAGHSRLVASAVAAPPGPAAPCREAAGTAIGTAAGKPQLGGRPLASHPVRTDWLAYSRHVAGLELTAQEAVTAHLARLLGRGGRWAWHEADEGLLEEEEEDGSLAAAGNDAADQRHGQLTILSTRGAGQRGSQRHRSRGRSLAGAVGSSLPQHWLSSALPPELKACVASGALLSAEQEAQLAELVRQAKRAARQCGVRRAARLPEAAAAALAAGARSCQSGTSQPDAELALVLRRGVAAQQLLVTANTRLVKLAQRRLQAGQQLGEPVVRELLVAGHCALWRAAAGYSPDARPGGCRFSTYAVAAIRNAMRDVLAGRGSRVVSPPSAAQGSAKQAVLNTSEPSPVLEAEQQQLLRGMRREAAWDSQLRVAEQLAQQRLAAAARHQVLASAASLVVLPALRNGASAINGRRPKARFDELAPVAGPDPVEQAALQTAVEEAAQLILSRLQPSNRVDVLRLRFDLDRSDRGGVSTSGRGEGGEDGLVDFRTVGRQLGVSRQRACALYRLALEQAAEEAARLGLFPLALDP